MSLFGVGHLLVGVGPPSGVVWYPVRLHWRKVIFPLQVVQLEIDSGLGTASRVHFPSQHWDPI